MFEFIDCKDVLMADYQTPNIPFWQHHPSDRLHERSI